MCSKMNVDKIYGMEEKGEKYVVLCTYLFKKWWDLNLNPLCSPSCLVAFYILYQEKKICEDILPFTFYIETSFFSYLINRSFDKIAI